MAQYVIHMVKKLDPVGKSSIVKTLESFYFYSAKSILFIPK